jgi:hypothetical protein
MSDQINIKFCVKLRKNARDICAVLFETYGGKAMKKSGIFELHKQFEEGCKNMEDDERSNPGSHRTSENVEKVQNLVHSDRHLSMLWLCN